MLIRKMPTSSTPERAFVVLLFYGICSVSLMTNLTSNGTHHGFSVHNYESSSGLPIIRHPSMHANDPHNAATSLVRTVSCGNHTAVLCSACPGGSPVGEEDNCKGDCFWHPVDKRCVPKRAVAGAGYETISGEDVTYLRDVLATVTEVFHEHRIHYWLDAGTLIGAMRNRPPGLNRWDDDLDIGIRNQDYSEVEKILARDKRLVVKSKVWGGNGYGLAAYEKYGSISVERFALDLLGFAPFQERDKPVMWYSYDRNNSHKIYEDRVAYKPDEIDKTVNCTFWDLEVRCPKHGIKALKRQFGDRVLSRAVAFNHITDTRFVIGVESDDVNHYLAYLPALNHDLVKKLLPNANLDSPAAL